MKTTEEALADLHGMADWADGTGNCGCWSTRLLAGRWGWPHLKAHRYLARLAGANVIRKIRRNTGTHIILLKKHGEFDAVSLSRAKRGDVGRVEQISLSIVATFFGVAESHVRGILNSRTRKRGRPSRHQRDQDIASMWIYAMHICGGLTPHQIMARNGVNRRAIVRTAAAIEDRRDNDPAFDSTLTQIEAAYRAAEAVIRRHEPGK